VVCWGEEIRESGGLAVGLEWVGMGQDVDLQFGHRMFIAKDLAGTMICLNGAWAI